LIGNEIVEIGIGEHLVRALRALADDDVAEIPGSDMAVERLDRAAELGSGLRCRFEPVRRGLARLARGAIKRREKCLRVPSARCFDHRCCDHKDHVVARAQKRGRTRERRERRALGGLDHRGSALVGEHADLWFRDINELGHATPSCGVLIKPRLAVPTAAGALIKAPGAAECKGGFMDLLRASPPLGIR